MANVNTFYGHQCNECNSVTLEILPGKAIAICPQCGSKNWGEFIRVYQPESGIHDFPCQECYGRGSYAAYVYSVAPGLAGTQTVQYGERVTCRGCNGTGMIRETV